MPGEAPHSRGRRFVDNVCYLFDNKFGFTIGENCYEGEGAASLVTPSGTILFDIRMNQTRIRNLPNRTTEKYRIQYFCECKYQTMSNGLLGDFKSFILNKAIPSVDTLNSMFTGNFGFLFFTNHYFRFRHYNVSNLTYYDEIFANEANYDRGRMEMMMGKLGIVILPDELLSTLLGGI